MFALTDKAWSPYAAGILIGLLQIPAFLLIHTALGASSAYVTIAGHLAGIIDPGIAQIEYVAKHLAGAKNWWQVALVGGIALGAALSARLSGSRRAVMSYAWSRGLGITSLAGRLPLAFAAGFIMLFGARVADGCTSGHGLSGMAQLAISSFIAVTAMFAGGIATAMLMRRV
ncbi:YeeE/YedE thiosulfate transporter family protein [Ferrovibrio xuzhouensis]|uniref:YeeE/YedE thiosulfate transporter family protein n=1 Tax=Ferrovibrio xuzhouensis TaxID=1576914 RepID=A0ABV7VLV0_9PROT